MAARISGTPAGTGIKKQSFLFAYNTVVGGAPAQMQGTNTNNGEQPLSIPDDFGLQPLSQEIRLTLLQLLGDRYGKKSIVIILSTASRKVV